MTFHLKDNVTFLFPLQKPCECLRSRARMVTTTTVYVLPKAIAVIEKRILQMDVIHINPMVARVPL
eukprot:m.190959 g.190959  ORF g.190959 m.190959 type:complete len:66 (-) comp16953_c0_seq1:366-563(-)